MMLKHKVQWEVERILLLVRISLLNDAHSHFFFLAIAAAGFYGGINGHAILHQRGPDVRVNISTDFPFTSWQIHELSVDLTIDPKLHCRPEHVGNVNYLQHSSRDWNYIYNVTITSLVMHSIVILVNEEVVTCGTIFSAGFPEFPAFLKFKTGVFGKMYIVHWPLPGVFIMQLRRSTRYQICFIIWALTSGEVTVYLI